jgi:hypothetical protein
MLALIASALLGLYVFAPYIFFHRVSSLFIRLKKFQRTKTEEIVAGIIVAGLPFAATLLLFSTSRVESCCVPFTPADLAQHAPPGVNVSDYRIVLNSAYSEHYFTNNEQATWDALSRAYKRQADFLVWNYAFLLIETVGFILLTRNYWRLQRYKPYAWLASRVLLPAVSEWHILLTDFAFPPSEHRTVKADIMSKDNILYRGDVADYFLDSGGELSGLLLKGTERFQYDKLKEDRKNNVNKDTEEYWKVIAGGGNFYLPQSNIASLNIRYALPETAFRKAILDAIKRLNIKGISNVNVQPFRGKHT